MIIRVHRFHGYNALRHAYGRGQTVRGPMLAIKYLRNPKRTSYRAAVVVSRKVHKSAVVRGRIRRRIYEIIRGQEDNIHEPYDIIVTVFSEQLAVVSASELHEAVVSQLERTGIVTAITKSTIMSNRGQTNPTVELPKDQTHAQTHAIVDTKERT